MKPIAARHVCAGLMSLASLVFATHAVLGANPQQKAATRRAAPAAAVKSFDSPQQAADALVAAAETFDTAALEQLFGPSTKDVIFSKEPAQDRQRAKDFVERAREKEDVTIDPKNRTRATLLVGKDNWPF